MDYRETAKALIRFYARYCVDNRYEFDTYDNYRSVFYWIMSDALNTKYTIDIKICSKYISLQRKFLVAVKVSGLLDSLATQVAKNLVFDIIKAMFDIVISDLKESE